MTEAHENEAIERLIEGELSGLKDALKRATTSHAVRQALGPIAALAAAASGSKVAVAASSLLDAAMTKLSDELVAEEQEERRIDEAEHAISEGGGHAPKTGLEKAVYKYLPEAKKFFESIDPDKNYNVVSVDENGNVREGKPEKASGQTLRDDFTRLTFHSLDDSQQAEARAEDRKDKEPLLAGDEKTEMENLKTSLKRMEGFRAGQLLEEGRADARDKIRANHAHFKEADQKIDYVNAMRDTAAVVPGLMKPAMQMVHAAARDDLRHTLKEKVIGKALLDGKGESHVRARGSEQGVEVSAAEAISSNLHAGQDGVGATPAR